MASWSPEAKQPQLHQRSNRVLEELSKPLPLDVEELAGAAALHGSYPDIFPPPAGQGLEELSAESESAIKN